jgi:hypothetical protein
MTEMEFVASVPRLALTLGLLPAAEKRFDACRIFPMIRVSGKRHLFSACGNSLFRAGITDIRRAGVRRHGRWLTDSNRLPLYALSCGTLT